MMQPKTKDTIIHALNKVRFRLHEWQEKGYIRHTQVVDMGEFLDLIEEKLDAD